MSEKGSTKSSEMSVVKVTCSTGKAVFLREMLIKDQETAMAGISPKIPQNANAYLVTTMLAPELAKLLIVQIDKKRLSGMEKEDLDSILTHKEYAQVAQVIRDMIGEDDTGNGPKVEYTKV